MRDKSILAELDLHRDPFLHKVGLIVWHQRFVACRFNRGFLRLRQQGMIPPHQVLILRHPERNAPLLPAARIESLPEGFVQHFGRIQQTAYLPLLLRYFRPAGFGIHARNHGINLGQQFGLMPPQ